MIPNYAQVVLFSITRGSILLHKAFTTLLQLEFVFCSDGAVTEVPAIADDGTVRIAAAGTAEVDRHARGPVVGSVGIGDSLGGSFS